MAWPSEFDFTKFIVSGGILSGGCGKEIGTPHLASGLAINAERILLGSGTASVPTIAFAGFPATGWFQASPNNWSFSVLGIEVFRFSAFGASIILSPDLGMLSRRAERVRQAIAQRR